MEQYLARNKALFIMQLRILFMPNEDTKRNGNEIDTPIFFIHWERLK